MAGKEDMFDFSEFEPDLEEGEDTVADAVEVEEVEEVEEPKLKTKPKASKQIVKAQTETSPSLDSLSLDFSSLESIPGVVVGEVGTKISSLPVERAKFSKNERALISILTSNVICLKTHYREGVGNFICLGSSCCETDGIPTVRYIFPIVRYETNKKGAPISPNVDYQVLSVGAATYENLIATAELNGPLESFDLLVSCSDEQFQKISFTLAGAARWKNSKKLVKETSEFWKEHMKDIVLPIAKRLTLDDLKRLKEAEGEDSGSTNISFDDVFGS